MNINRIRTNLTLNKQNAKSNLKTVSSGIGVNQAMVKSFDSQCIIAKEGAKDFPISQNVKKKRTALENISNAGTNNNINSSITSNKEAATKKSRFGNPVFGIGAAATATLGSNAKKADATKKAIKSSKEAQSSKENIRVPFTTTTFQAKKKTNEHKAAPLASNSNKLKLQAKSLESITNTTTETKKEKVLKNETKTTIKKDVYISETEQISTTMTTTTTAKNNISLAKSEISIEDEELIESLKPVTSSTSSMSNQSSTSSSSAFPDADNVNGWEDIDADDVDEFSASDYVTSIFKYYKERESSFLIEDYLKRQPQLNKQMRLLLVDWMVEVQQQLEFNHEVLYLSVKLLDLYLNSRCIEKEKLQLLGGAAMFVACKFEERMPPIIDDFIFVSDNAYDRDELVKMEIEILKTVRFDIGVPLSYTFLRRYSKCVKADMRFLTLARYILELTLQDYNFAYLCDSEKACAALYLALKMAENYEKSCNAVDLKIKSEPQMGQRQLIINVANLTSTEWNATLVHFTGYYLKDFIHHVPAMNNLLKTATLSKYKTIFKKYSHQVFYEVAKIAPLNEQELSDLVNNSTTIDLEIVNGL